MAKRWTGKRGEVAAPLMFGSAGTLAMIWLWGFLPPRARATLSWVGSLGSRPDVIIVLFLAMVVSAATVLLSARRATRGHAVWRPVLVVAGVLVSVGGAVLAYVGWTLYYLITHPHSD